MDFNALGVLRAVSRDKKKTALVVIAGIAILSLMTGFVGQLIVTTLIVTEIVLSFFLGRMEVRQFGIEIVTMTTVISGALYGPLIGAVVGAVLLSIRFILTKSLGVYVLYCIPMMVVIGAISGFSVAALGGIAIAGIVLSGIYNLVTASLGTAIINDFFQEVVWSGTDFALNALLFWYVAPVIVALA